jgi:SAM-dependent methyltransferase
MNAHDVDGRAIGEIVSVQRLLDDLRIDSGDAFLDVGSGRGNVVLACARRRPPPASACGIEMVPARHAMAVAAMDGGGADGAAAFVLGDAFAADQRPQWQRATKVFCNNLLFDEATNAALARCMCPNHAPRLLLVACTRPLADPVTAARALAAVGRALERTSTVDANYSKGGPQPLYIYERIDRPHAR